MGGIGQMIYEDGFEQGEKRGEKRGERRGRIETLASVVRETIEAFGVTADVALTLFGATPEERDAVMERLQPAAR